MPIAQEISLDDSWVPGEEEDLGCLGVLGEILPDIVDQQVELKAESVIILVKKSLCRRLAGPLQRSQ
jgi:hypothetical protein